MKPRKVTYVEHRFIPVRPGLKPSVHRVAYRWRWWAHVVAAFWGRSASFWGLHSARVVAEPGDDQ